MDRSKRNTYLFENDQTPFEEIEEGINSDVVQNLLFGAVLGVIFLFLISLCWNTCAGDDSCTDKKQNDRDMVIAQEIRPGMLVIKGTSEETLRIIQEYEGIRLQQQQQYNYGSTSGFITGQMPVPMQSTQHHQQMASESLIDLGDQRPPPYAPVAQPAVLQTNPNNTQ